MKSSFCYHINMKQVLDYLKNHKIEDKVSYFYYNTVTKETYLYRENELYLAASTIKVPVVLAWMDLVNKNKVTLDTKFKYEERHYEESDEIALYDTYKYGDLVPLSELIHLPIVYSDNPSNHMLREYIYDYIGMSFREWYSKFSLVPQENDFYYKNQCSAAIMLEVMKKLYDHSNEYISLINDMKIAAKGRYIQSNHFDYEVAQKYGEYDKYEHTMAILYKEEPILVGIFTELWHENAKDVIKDLSKIMSEY